MSTVHKDLIVGHLLCEEGHPGLETSSPQHHLSLRACLYRFASIILFAQNA